MARRVKQLAVALTCLTVVGVALVPLMFEHALRGQLASLGFTHVQLGVASIGMKRVVLEDVEVDDVRVGRVEIEPGLGLIWQEPQRIRIPDAIATVPAVGALGAKVSRSPTRRSTKPARVELSVSLRDPTPGGWTATGTGTVVLGATPRIEDGHVEVAASAVRESPLVGRDVALSFRLDGALSPLDLRAVGSVRAARVELGPVTLDELSVPFAFDREGLSFGAGSATLFGGTVTSHAFRTRDREVVVDARGLRLDHITGSKSPIAATGVVDGQVAINLGSRESGVARGHLRARSAGTLRVRDPKWRAQLAAASGPATSAVTNALQSFTDDTLALEMPLDASKATTFAVAGRGAANHQPLELLVRLNGVQDAVRWLQEKP